MNQGQKLLLLLAFVSSLSLASFGALAGEPNYYALGSYAILAITIYSFLTISSGKTLLLLAIAIDLFLRYVPIVKFNQPLNVDPVHELATATEFEKNGRIYILPSTGYIRYEYSGWPLVHLLSITIHEISGLSLFNVFTYFAPLVDLSGLLFIYLLANRIFTNPKIGAFSALIYATFFENMFWTGTQLIRQNIGYSLALMAIYLYIKGNTDKRRKIMALCLLTFGILPIAHHFTPFEIFCIFVFGFFLESFRNSVSHWFTPILCFFVGVSTFMWWVTNAQQIILPIFAETVYTFIFSVIHFTPAGHLVVAVQRGGLFYMSTGVYDVLSYVRVLFIAIATLYGISILAKEKNRYRFLLYGLLLAPLLALLVYLFFEGSREYERHLLFLLIPTFVIAAKTMQKADKKVLALFLLIIILPAPFELFDLPGNPTPTFIYDKSSTGNIVVGRGVVYREDRVLAAASYFAYHTNDNLTADNFIANGLLFYYDPCKLRPGDFLLRVLSNPKMISRDQGIVLIGDQFFNIRYLVGLTLGRWAQYNVTVTIEELKDYRNRLNSVANCIYNSGDIVGWKSPRAP